MSNIEFIEGLQEIFYDDNFIKLLKQNYDINNSIRNNFIIKSLNYLISTRDFEGFNYYINHCSNDYFPYRYLKQKELSEEEINKLLYDNYIKNGFLFHITPNYNVEEILEKGLQTLNDRCGFDVYQKSNELNKMYVIIKQRNKDILSLNNLISVPGYNKLEQERFNSVYLSSNLGYVLKTYGKFSELSNLYVSNLFYAFGRQDNIENLEKKELRLKIIDLIKNSGAIIFEKEIDTILDFFDTTYKDKFYESNNEQAIILVPTNSINNNDKMFNALYKDNSLGLTIDRIIEINDGEVEYKGSIPSENIVAITQKENKVLTLRKGKK